MEVGSAELAECDRFVAEGGRSTSTLALDQLEYAVGWRHPDAFAKLRAVLMDLPNDWIDSLFVIGAGGLERLAQFAKDRAEATKTNTNNEGDK